MLGQLGSDRTGSLLAYHLSAAKSAHSLARCEWPKKSQLPSCTYVARHLGRMIYASLSSRLLAWMKERACGQGPEPFIRETLRPPRRCLAKQSKPSPKCGRSLGHGGRAHRPIHLRKKKKKARRRRMSGKATGRRLFETTSFNIGQVPRWSVASLVGVKPPSQEHLSRRAEPVAESSWQKISQVWGWLRASSSDLCFGCKPASGFSSQLGRR